MTKSKFLAWLAALPGDPEILAWDPDEGDWAPITGAIYNAHEVKLYTDYDATSADDC
jgi:hypothetical protein